MARRHGSDAAVVRLPPTQPLGEAEKKRPVVCAVAIEERRTTETCADCAGSTNRLTSVSVMTKPADFRRGVDSRAALVRKRLKHGASETRRRIGQTASNCCRSQNEDRPGEWITRHFWGELVRHQQRPQLLGLGDVHPAELGLDL